MASRWWVGGTAAWDGTAGSKWAATSGGAGGASVPTTADDVFFDTNSSGTVTIAAGNTGAKSIDCTGFTGGIAGTAAITVAGSITLDAGQTYTHTGTVTITGTGTLTTAGKTFSGVIVDAAGNTVTLGDALNCTNNRDAIITQGTFDTADYNLTARNLNSNNSNTRTIELGSSTVALSAGQDYTNSTNLTFNAGTSQINHTAATLFLRTSGQTFHNVSFTSTGTGTRAITGASTFNDLTLNASATGLSQLSLGDDQTVNGTFTCAGSSAVARGFVRSGVLGTTRTITAAAVSANDCDFRDIEIAGAAAPISPTRAGDCGGNSGITFPAAKSAFRVGTVLTWSGSNSWALTSGGTGSNDNFPLAQDTAVIDDNTTLTGTLGLSPAYNNGALDASNRTTAVTLSFTAANNFYGSYTLGSGVTVSGTSNQTFLGRGTQTFTSAGKTITFPITVDKPAGAFELGDAYESSNPITLTRGTLDAKNYNVTLTGFLSNNSNTRTFTMGSGLWTVSGFGTPWNFTTITNLTFNKDTANILLSNTTSARTIQGGGLTYNKLTIGGATGTSTTTISGANSFTELASTKTVAHTITFGANQTINTWSVTGTSGNVVTVNSSAAGTRRTINLTNATSGIDFLDVKDIGITDPDKFYVGDNSTDSGNNLNVIFTAAPIGGITAVGGAISPVFDASGQASQIINAAANVNAPTTQASGVADQSLNATGNASTPNVEAQGQAAQTVNATAQIDTPVTQAAGTAAEASPRFATGDAQTPATTAQGQAAQTVTATGSAATPSPQAVGTGTALNTASGAISPPATAAQGQARQVLTASGGAAVGGVTATGVVLTVVRSSGNASAPATSVSGQAEQATQAQGNAIAPSVQVQGQARTVVIAFGAAVIPAITARGLAGDLSKQRFEFPNYSQGGILAPSLRDGILAPSLRTGIVSKG
jgi:hypothetical protein